MTVPVKLMCIDNNDPAGSNTFMLQLTFGIEGQNLKTPWIKLIP